MDYRFLNRLNFTLLSPIIGFYTAKTTLFLIDKTLIQPKSDEKKQ